jgi:hypothetical protein
MIKFPRNLACGDESLYYRRRREDQEKFLYGRKGDWLLAPFQCNRCWFLNLRGKLPNANSYADANELRFIRRANLDMFWSRAEGTVRSSIGDLKQIVEGSISKGRMVPLVELEPWPVGDDVGMGIALLMLEKSIKPGRNSKHYTQFDSCRSYRSATSNLYAASFLGASEHLALKSLKGQIVHTYRGSMQSVFMERFVSGMEIRMPQSVNRNKAMLGEITSCLLERMNDEYLSSNTSIQRKRLLAMSGGYISTCYGYSLRGNEGLWVDGDRLVENIELGKFSTREDEPSHVVVALLGYFKGEDGARMHVFPIASETKSGIKVRVWLERVSSILRIENKHRCPAFCDADGFSLRERDVEDVMHPFLEEIQMEGELNGGLIDSSVDVRDKFRCLRSFRRGSETTALSRGISATTIKFIHRWSQYEKKKGQVPGYDMLEHYAEGESTRPIQLRFSGGV